MSLPQHPPFRNKSPAISFSKEARACTTRLKELLHSDLDHHFSMSKLAKKVGLNARTLHDCFKHLFGKSIFTYGQEIRLEYSKKLLQDPDLTIQSVAEKCGYREQSNFGKAFRKKYGIGPGEWRKKNAAILFG
jgi:AraC family transcriptional regulator